jgi:hypothetical protein
MGPTSDKAQVDGAFVRLQEAGLLTWSEADQEVTWNQWFERAYVTEGAPAIRLALQLLKDRDAQDLLLYLISKERNVPLDALTAAVADVLRPK